MNKLDGVTIRRDEVLGCLAAVHNVHFPSLTRGGADGTIEFCRHGEKPGLDFIYMQPFFPCLLRILSLGAYLCAMTVSAHAIPVKECTSDRECIAINNGCCGCSAGGSMRAVPKAKATHERRTQEAHCQQTACLTVMSEHPSCGAQPQCSEGRCVLSSDKASAAPTSPAPSATVSDAPLVTTARELEARRGQVVLLRGRYVQIDVRTPPQQPAVYRGHAGIILTDGTTVALYGSEQPEAIRPSDELSRFADQLVTVVGKLQLAQALPGYTNGPVRPCLVDVGRITAEPQKAKGPPR